MAAQTKFSAQTTKRITGVLAEIVHVIGPDAAMTLITARGGTSFYLPSAVRVGDEHWLVKLLGREAAEKLCNYFSFSAEGVADHGAMAELPSGHTLKVMTRRLAVRDMTRDGMSAAEIALRFGITTRCVTRIRSALREARELP